MTDTIWDPSFVGPIQDSSPVGQIITALGGSLNAPPTNLQVTYSGGNNYGVTSYKPPSNVTWGGIHYTKPGLADGLLGGSGASLALFGAVALGVLLLMRR